MVKLKTEDIDTQRKLIHIKCAKGRKDRWTILLDMALQTLGFYEEAYAPRKWLFPGRREDSQLTVRNVEKIFDNAVREAKTKKGSICS